MDAHEWHARSRHPGPEGKKFHSIAITNGGKTGASMGIGCDYVKAFGPHVFIVYSFGEYFPPSESKCRGRTPSGNSWALVQSTLKAITGT